MSSVAAALEIQLEGVQEKSCRLVDILALEGSVKVPLHIKEAVQEPLRA